MGILIFFFACPIAFFVYLHICNKIDENKNRTQLCNKLRQFQHKYPVAFYQKFGKEPFYEKMDYRRLQEMAQVKEEELRKLELGIKASTERYYTSLWLSKQNSFVENIISNKKKYLKKWHGVKYKIGISGIDKFGFEVQYPYTVCQVFLFAFCRDESIDYSLDNSFKINYENLLRILDKTTRFPDAIYQQLANFILQFREEPENEFLFFQKMPIVVFCDSNQGEQSSSLNKSHFSFLKQILENKRVSCMDFQDFKEKTEWRNSTCIIMVELITSNELMIDNCTQLLNLYKEKSPCIFYVSLFKEFSSKEMNKRIKFIRDARAKEDNAKRIEQENNVAEETLIASE